MIIVNCNGEWIYFTELQWAYWRDAFRVVISETGMTMRRSNEKTIDTTGDTIRGWVLRAGSVYSVDARVRDQSRLMV